MKMPQTPPNPTSSIPQKTITSPIEQSVSSSPSKQQQQQKKKATSKPTRVYRLFQSILRSFPTIAPHCRFPSSFPPNRPYNCHTHGGIQVIGTLFGQRKARISLAFQDTPRSLPTLLLSLAISTKNLLQEMAIGLARITLECEKRAAEKTQIVDEPIWAMFCNGREMGHVSKREPNEEDLRVMELLYTVSMGAGVLPSHPSQPSNGELMYMRAHFERVAGSMDSETYYMLSPDGNGGPELSIFFVRI